jgi:sulfite exporter TauE/SafE
MDMFHGFPLSPAIPALCGIGDALSLLGISITLFGVGLVGGFAHCAPMCGPFVLMQIAASEGGGFAVGKLAAGALPGYQLGRMTTYVTLGAMMGGLGGSIAMLTQFRGLLALLLGFAAASFLLQAVRRLVPRFQGPTVPGYGAGLAVPLVRLIRANRGFALKGYPLGLVLGLLPCGFLYAALIAAGATGGALGGGIAMAGFALGTAPALMTVGVLGAGAALRWRTLAAELATPVFLINAITLGGLALRSLA